MKFCQKCGSQIDDNANICSHCGAEQPAVSNDTGGIGWGLLGCCIPVVGLVLFLVWRDSKPKTAKAVGIGALVSVLCSIAWYILVIATGVTSSLMM